MMSVAQRSLTPRGSKVRSSDGPDAQVPALATVALYIVSCGIDPFRHATLEALQILRKCTGVFTISSNRAVHEFLEQHKISYSNIGSTYVEKTSRRRIYHQIAKRVVSEALACPGVCYLTYGHPLMLDGPVMLMLEEAQKKGLVVHVAAGISFLDALWVDAGVCIGVEGFSVIEATDLVENVRTVDPTRPLIVAQVGSFASTTAQGLSVMEAGQLAPLLSYLYKFYSKEHIVTLIEAASDWTAASSVSLPLRLLPLALEGISYATSLYVPAAVEPRKRTPRRKAS